MLLNYIVYIFPTIVIFGIILFFNWYLMSVRTAQKSFADSSPQTSSAPERLPDAGTEFTLSGRRYPMEKADALPLIILTLVYAATAFFNLGGMKAPQTFLSFDSEAPSVTIDLGAETMIASVFYYTGLWSGSYDLEFSRNTYEFHVMPAMEQSHANLFKWQHAVLSEEVRRTRYIRITANSSKLELGELALYDYDGNLIPTEIFGYDRADGGRLFDEQDIVPAESTYMNSAYFDEIYHARTAYEHLRGIYPYEISHPPLGKLIIMQGIKLFGMTPFGYRCMGALFGVLMLPVIYTLIKNMFGKTRIAFMGTVLFAFDFMHYVQTRISTIDVYGVFFILLMYLFMFRYITADYEKPIQSQLTDLLLCGISFGLGAAAKWISIYAGLGLIALYIINLIMRARYYARRDRREEIRPYVGATILYSLLFFIVIPVLIYCASYYPYWTANGREASLKNTLSEVWANQKYMFSYHKGVYDEHPFSSKWWMWIVDARPILYYATGTVNGMKSLFGAFGNPLVIWGGLVALVTVCFRIKGNRNKSLIWFIIIGYLSQMLPWVIIPRVTFAYHYFPSIIFLVLAICFVFNELFELKPDGYIRKTHVFTAASVLLFIMFYPALSGIAAPEWYFSKFLKWFPSWPF